jgi:hypothetical protein
MERDEVTSSFSSEGKAGPGRDSTRAVDSSETDLPGGNGASGQPLTHPPTADTFVHLLDSGG